MNSRHDRTEEDLHALVERFFRSTFSTDNRIITEAVKRMLAAGGKRLRPRITLLAAAACGGKAIDHLHLAAYMELIHVATLIHDDVVDNAPTRRGVNATAVDYGNRVSVLAGDYLFAWIFKNVTMNYPHPIPNVLSATLADICDGEVLQLQATGDLDLSLDAYVEIACKKTASLFAASAQCGAVVAGAKAPQANGLRAFGELFGIAFQMKDDLLDICADERSLGKPVGNDLTERKVTIPLIEALKRGDARFRGEVQRFYGGASNDAIPSIVAGIAHEGGLHATNRQIAAYVKRAKDALKPIPEGTPKEELLQLADALLAR
ncbi:MAG: polyprenyl synthetase family protein [Candidatus Eremiobacteraeota bacterium]|nr:polyprenyl synthetase family protein [Candidatus Eremiobacteraeota bacterium]MBV8374596.1 polyprenyl synthetase family protein [Candidatus Eremiobacteraeota bacterium]